MATWLRWRRWFGSVDYERELPRLADQISAAQTALASARAAQRKWPALFLLQTAAVYAVYAAFVVLSESRKRRFSHQAALVLVPVLLWLVFKTLARALAVIVGRRERALKALTDRRKMLVDEYKKKTNFDRIRELIADPQASDAQKSQPGMAGPAPPRNTKQTKQASARSATGTLKGAKPDSTTPTHGASNQAPRGDPSALQRQLAASGLASQPLPAQAQPPTGPNRRTWIDRLVDLVLGENELSPANRDALICPKCFNHNGLAPFGKGASEITYRCPMCGHLNVGTEPTQAAGKTDASSDSIAEAGSDSKLDSSALESKVDDFLESKSDDTLDSKSDDTLESKSHDTLESKSDDTLESKSDGPLHSKPIADWRSQSTSSLEPESRENAASDFQSDAPLDSTVKDGVNSKKHDAREAARLRADAKVPTVDVLKAEASRSEAEASGSEDSRIDALKSQDSGRQGSPASSSTESAKSISQHLEGPDEDADTRMTVEERIMKEINDIRKEISDSKAGAAKPGSASSSVSASSRSSPAA